MSHSDQKYIDALLSNNCELLRELYTRFSGTIKKMVISNNGTAQDASDVFQDGLMALYSMAKDKEFVLRGPLEPYLYGICKNKWLKKIKKNSTAGVTKLHDGGNIDIKDVPDEESESVNRERKKFVFKKMCELGYICRQLIELSISGIPLYDVANMMNMSYAYARRRKSECLSALMKLVRQSPEYEQLKW